MKISLILATREGKGVGSANGLVPLGIGFIAASIKTSCPGVEVLLHESIEELLEAKPDIAGISAVTENYHLAIDFAKTIKDKLNIPIILGGVHISLQPLSLHEAFDIAVIGEGEQTIVELLKSYKAFNGFNFKALRDIDGLFFFQGGKPVQTRRRELIKNLDSLPVPDYKNLPFYSNTGCTHIFSARGCPYKCSFCASSRFFNNYRTNSIERVATQIEEFISDNVKHIVFFDDLFIAEKKRVAQLIELLKERDLLGKCTYSCQARTNLITDGVCELLVELGVKDCGLGVESFNDKILTYFNKKPVTAAINQRALDILHKHGIMANAGFIFGTPIETREDILLTLDKVLENVEAGKLHDIAWGALRPYPGTAVWDQAKTMGLVSDDMDWSRFDASRMGHELYMGTNVSVQELHTLVDEYRDKITAIKIRNNALQYLSGNMLLKNPPPFQALVPIKDAWIEDGARVMLSDFSEIASFSPGQCCLKFTIASTSLLEISGNLPAQLNIYIDGKLHDTLHIRDRQPISLTIATPERRTYTLRFECDKSCIPSELGDWLDSRSLSVMLYGFERHPLNEDQSIMSCDENLETSISRVASIQRLEKPLIQVSLPKCGTHMISNILRHFANMHKTPYDYTETYSREMLRDNPEVLATHKKIEERGGHTDGFTFAHLWWSPQALWLVRNSNIFLLLRHPKRYAASLITMLSSPTWANIIPWAQIARTHQLGHDDLFNLVLYGNEDNLYFPSLRESYINYCIKWLPRAQFVLDFDHFRSMVRALDTPAGDEFMLDFLHKCGIAYAEDWKERVRAGLSASCSKTASSNTTSLTPLQQELIDIQCADIYKYVGYTSII
ncbi:B12-binding domain-containing radical SAM protein [Fundidesulfovibrio soli]|uniref:B12-binding domain-containing radical SAM protein n=1 Tax=Fundidesulfovibrio soli TaxID=2922716 RepID=UPI001FAF598E|nr:radical SAM protein [Fundidesulfovibrio soli]